MPPTLTNGLRMAVDRGDSARGLPARSAFAGAVLGVAAVTAALVFVPSLDHLAATPRLYGWTWDLALRDNTSNTACGAGDYGVSDVPGTAALSEVCTQNVQLDGHPVAALAFARLRGRADARGCRRRAGAAESPRDRRRGPRPSTSWARASGTPCTRRAGAAALDFRIVGRVALPTLGQSQPLEDGAIFTGRGFTPLFDQNLFERYFVVRFAAGADAAAVTGQLVAIPQLERQSGPTRPVEIARVQQVELVPVHVGDPSGHAGPRRVAARAGDERSAPPCRVRCPQDAGVHQAAGARHRRVARDDRWASSG